MQKHAKLQTDKHILQVSSTQGFTYRLIISQQQKHVNIQLKINNMQHDIHTLLMS